LFPFELLEEHPCVLIVRKNQDGNLLVYHAAEIDADKVTPGSVNKVHILQQSNGLVGGLKVESICVIFGVVVVVLGITFVVTSIVVLT